jgi:uncharacterized membrane protein
MQVAGSISDIIMPRLDSTSPAPTSSCTHRGRAWKNLMVLRLLMSCMVTESFVISTQSILRSSTLSFCVDSTGRHPNMSPSTTLLEMTSMHNSEAEHHDHQQQATSDKNVIYCRFEMDLPFSTEVAFDAFSDLTRQPNWSRWLKSVEYMDSTKQRTLWKMRYMGLSTSWEAVSKRLARPNLIEWESVSGLKNYGSVEFMDHHSAPDHSRARMKIGFVVPRLFAKLLGDTSGATKIVEDKMLKSTLENFREDVLMNDLQAARVSANSY